MVPFLVPPGSPPPVIGGSDSGPSQDAIVHVRSAIDGQPVACAGTVVAPRIVLTARHCVIGLKSPFTTCAGAAFEDATTAQLDSVTVSAGASVSSPSAERGVVSVIVPGPTAVCGNDFAALILDSALPAVSPAVRFDRRTVAGELVTIAGWGWTDTTALPLTRQQRQHIPILDVADSDRSWVMPDELVFGESICDGDSGGPLLSEETGALIGVASRMHRDDTQVIPPASCEGDAVRNVAGSTSVILDVMLRATQETGETIQPEASPSGAISQVGAACSADDECMSGRCEHDELGQACSMTCGELRPCPDGSSCEPEDGLMVCHRTAAADAGGGEDSGCGIATGSSRQSTGARVVVLATLAFLLGRKRNGKKPS